MLGHRRFYFLGMTACLALRGDRDYIQPNLGTVSWRGLITSGTSWVWAPELRNCPALLVFIRLLTR